MEQFVWLLVTLLHVLLPPLSHSIRVCTQRDRTLSLGLAAFCNGGSAEHYRKVRGSCSYSVFERKGNTPIDIHHQLTEVHGESCMDIKTSKSGVGSLHLVTLKFMMKNEAGDCQLATRPSRRLRKPCVKIGGSLCISAFRFLRFLEPPFIEFWRTSWNIWRCAQDGSHKCWQKVTNGNEWTLAINFFVVMQTKRLTFQFDCHRRWNLSIPLDTWNETTVTSLAAFLFA